MNETRTDEPEAKFTAAMRVADAMALHPRARWVFASYTIGGCTHCAVSSEETIEEVAQTYGVEPRELVTALNALLQEGVA